MKDIKIPPYVRSSNPSLALWQSAVAKAARNQIQKENPGISRREVYQMAFSHPMVLGTNLHVDRIMSNAPHLTFDDVKPYVNAKASNGELHHVVHSFLSQLYFAKAMAKRGNQALATESGDEPYGLLDSDYNWPAWVDAAIVWTLNNNHDPFVYITQDPGVITIPDNQRILILGDFGTGLDDGTAMLMAILNDETISPDIIIHVGDIYYSGTDDEVEAYVNMFTYAFSKTGKTVPVFSIPGNHEYYSSGAPFYAQVLPMNSDPSYKQKASYFCLQSSNWQLLGMDTGLNSIQVYTAPDLASESYGPWLWFDEAAWHQEKLAAFHGKTILFSHHQLYSVSALINDSKGVTWAGSGDSTTYKFLNANLMNVFSPYFDKVAAWFWGHEHSMGIYEDGQAGLSKGRLVGNSGYEEWLGQSPFTPQTGCPFNYTPNMPELGTTNIPFNLITPPPLEGPIVPKDLGVSHTDVYNHCFAIMQLDDANGSAEVSYYQYPLLVAIPSEDRSDIPPVDQLPPVPAPLFRESI